MVRILAKDVWRYFETILGELCVMITSLMPVQELFATCSASGMTVLYDYYLTCRRSSSSSSSSSSSVFINTSVTDCHFYIFICTLHFYLYVAGRLFAVSYYCLLLLLVVVDRVTRP